MQVFIRHAMLKLKLSYGDVRPLFSGKSRHDAVLRAMRGAPRGRIASVAHSDSGRYGGAISQRTSPHATVE